MLRMDMTGLHPFLLLYLFGISFVGGVLHCGTTDEEQNNV